MNTIDTQTGEVTERSIKAVAHKITLAMADMDAYASKDGKNTFHKYEYTSIAQYMAHVRPALVKHGLVIIPSLISHTDYDDATTDVLMEYTIIDSESGEYLKVRTVGRGQDASSNGKRLDKGPYKAYSGAFKYFLAETFMIASGDDPDDSGPKLGVGKQESNRPVKPDEVARRGQKVTPGDIWLPAKEEFFDKVVNELKTTEADAKTILKAAGYTGYLPEKATEMYKAIEKELRIRKEAEKVKAQVTNGTPQPA